MTVATLPDMKSVRRVVIIRGSAIGDVLHATPLAAALKEAFPQLEITWITEEICGDVLIGNPYLEEVIVIPRSRWKQGRLTSPRVWGEYLAFLRSLRRRHFEVSIDLQGYAKSAILAFASGAPYRLGWWRMRDGANLVSSPLPRRPESVHRVDWFLDVGRLLGADPCTPRFALAIPDSARVRVAELLAEAGLEAGQPFVVLNQAAGDPARRWPEAGFAQVAWELAQHYRLPSVLVGVEKDREANSNIIEGFRQLAAGSDVKRSDNCIHEPIDLAGKTDLKQLFALIERCVLQVSGDTGSLHIAAALGRPVVGLFGSSDPAHAGPWGQLENVVSHRELCRADCTVRRCAYTLGQSAPRAENSAGGNEGGVREAATSKDPFVKDPFLRQTAYCLEAITPEEVFQKIVGLLG